MHIYSNKHKTIIVAIVIHSLLLATTVTTFLIASLTPDLSDYFSAQSAEILETLETVDTSYLSQSTSFRSRYGISGFAHCSVNEDPGSPCKKTNPITKPELAAEALASLHLAKEMRVNRKMDKAAKLFNHALALDPNNPDIYNEYGEYLEHHVEDVLQAEHHYLRAITYSPIHSRALQNRQRTLPLVEQIDQLAFDVIDKKREMLFQVPESHAGLCRMKQESYYRHIHHSTAIEGNTFTLSQTRVLIETRMAIGGKSVMEHNEIIGMDAALSFVNSTLLRRIGRITVEDILAIHKRVLGFNDPFEAGKFRDTQVFVGDFIPPSASEVESLVNEFVEWLNHEDTLSLHPIESAALAHYKLVIIHPFYDGNGRTSRLLMNLILMQAGFPPVIIQKEEKYEYYEHLEAANNGDVRPFIRFISRCTERTLDEFLMAATTSLNHTGISAKHKDDGRTIIMDPYENKSDGG